MGQGAFRCVDEQQHAVHHFQYALDLSAEVGVTGGVDYIDLAAVIIHRSIFCHDRNTAFTLQVVRVHDPFLNLLIGPENAGLSEHAIEQRCLAMVDVGDNGDVS